MVLDPLEASDRAHNPDLKFSNWHHAYVTGVIAASLMQAESFSCHIASGSPSVIVRFGQRRYEVIVAELQ